MTTRVPGSWCWRRPDVDGSDWTEVISGRPLGAGEVAELAAEDQFRMDPVGVDGIEVEVCGPAGELTRWVVDVRLEPVFEARSARG